MADVVFLKEPVAVAALRSVASSNAAAEWYPSGSPVSLRGIIHDVLACVRGGYITSCWHQESADRPSRRYSGCAISGKATGELAMLRDLQASGVNKATIGRSLFGLPGCIRNLARAGLQDFYVLDLVNAHPAITLKRHPSMAALASYVNNREQVLASIPARRAAAKELFIRLLYGGKPSTWCQEYGVDISALPPIVAELQSDICKIHAADGGDPGTEQYRLSTEIERLAIDAVEKLLKARGAAIHAYEHDGLAFTLPVEDVGELIQAWSSACGFIVSIAHTPSFAECVKVLQEKSGLADWTPRRASSTPPTDFENTSFE
jgi:hypothetical protein